MAWNAPVTGWDGVRVCGTTGVVARDDSAAKNTVPRTHEDAACGAETNATERGGVSATVACNAVVVGRDAASAGWSMGW